MKGSLIQRKILLAVSTMLILTLTLSGCAKRIKPLGTEPNNMDNTVVASPGTSVELQPTDTSESSDTGTQSPIAPDPESTPASESEPAPPQSVKQTDEIGAEPTQGARPKPLQGETPVPTPSSEQSSPPGTTPNEPIKAPEPLKNPEPAKAPEPVKTPEPVKAVSPSKPYVIIGDSIEEVIAVMGPPASIFNNYVEATFWYNGSSCSIHFYNQGDGMKVIGWSNYDNYLKVSIVPRSSNAPPITIGSSKEAVSKSRGTPDWNSPYFGFKNFDKPTWTYQNGDYIAFDNNYKVMGWSDAGGLNVTLGKVNPSASPVTIGSTLEEVLNTLGTPLIVHNGSPSSVITQIIYSDCAFSFTPEGKVFDLTNHGNPQVYK